MADMKEREYWNEYMSAYEQCLSNTSTDNAPWYIVPADNKNNARLIISSVINETLKAFDLNYPSIDETTRKEILKVKKLLLQDG